jgi:hypothetical protein
MDLRAFIPEWEAGQFMRQFKLFFTLYASRMKKCPGMRLLIVE